MNLRSAAVAIAIGLALAVPGAVLGKEAHSAESPPTEEQLDAWCAQAFELLAQGLADKARARYEKVLDTDPDRPCAVEGRASAVLRYCENGGTLLQLGLLDKASDNLKKALEIEPSAPCAGAGLIDLATRHVALGDALAAAGYASKAEAEFARALAIDPELRIKDSPTPAFTRRWNAFAAVGRMAVMIAAPLALLGLIFLALRRFVVDPALDILPFESNSDKDLGKGFAALLRARLVDLAAGRPNANLDLVRGEITSIEIPAEVHGLLPTPATWLAPVVKLLSKLTARRSLVVGGTFHPAGSWGAGVTLQLTRGRKVSAAQTLWLEHFQAGPPVAAKSGEASDSYYLADLASVWLLFALSEVRGKGRVELLGTRDWKSYALFRAATFAFEKGRVKEAQQLYCRALERDAGLRGARVNLARIIAEAQ